MTRSEALARERRRLHDTKTPPHYEDEELHDYRNAALIEIADAVRAVDPDYWLSSAIVNGFTDALDKPASGVTDTTGYYEFYPLPADMEGLRRIERADAGSSWHPRIDILSPQDQESARFGGVLIRGTLELGGQTYPLPVAGAIETVSVWGDRFRVIPPPTAAGPIWRLFYDRQVRLPEGDDEVIDIPRPFEEALVLSTAIRALRVRNESSVQALLPQLYGGRGEDGELRRAQRSFALRARRDFQRSPPRFTG